jgi:hypothetical protein
MSKPIVFAVPIRKLKLPAAECHLGSLAPLCTVVQLDDGLEAQTRHSPHVSGSGKCYPKLVIWAIKIQLELHQSHGWQGPDYFNAVRGFA